MQLKESLNGKKVLGIAPLHPHHGTLKTADAQYRKSGIFAFEGSDGGDSAETSFSVVTEGVSHLWESLAAQFVNLCHKPRNRT
jgi:hypothetical protein